MRDEVFLLCIEGGESRRQSTGDPVIHSTPRKVVRVPRASVWSSPLTLFFYITAF